MSMLHLLLILCINFLTAMNLRGQPQRSVKQDDSPTATPSREIPTRFFKIKPANPLQASNKKIELLRSLKELEKDDFDNLREITEYAYQMFRDRFDGIVKSKQLDSHLPFLLDEIFSIFPLLSTRRICFYMQNILIERNLTPWIMKIYERYIDEMRKTSDQGLQKSLVGITGYTEVKSVYEKGFSEFLNQWTDNRREFDSRVELLFPRFSSIEETIDFVAEGLWLQYKNIKDGDALIRRNILGLDSDNALQMMTNMRDKINIIRFLARKVLVLKKLGKNDRGKKKQGLLELYHLMQPLRIKNSEGQISRYMEKFNIQVPGSPEWHYVRYRLKNLYQMSAKGETADEQNFMQLVVTTFDLLESRVHNAIAQHITGNVGKYLGYLVTGSTPDQLYLYAMMKRVNWDSGFSVLMQLQLGKTTMPNIINSRTYENACESYITELKYAELHKLNPDEWKRLVTKSFTGTVSTKVDNLIMLKPEMKKKTAVKSIKCELHQPDIKDQVNDSSLTAERPLNENNSFEEVLVKIDVGLGNHTTTNLAEEVILTSPQKPSINFQQIIASSKMVVEYDGDYEKEIADCLLQFQVDMDYHQNTTMRLNQLEYNMVSSIDSKVGLSKNTVELGTCKVVAMSTDDIIASIPEAYALYNTNKVNEIHWEAQSDKSAKYQWLFDEKVIIGNNAYLFLCQVFGQLKGRSHLTFNDFLKTMFELTYPSAPESDQKSHKNRTVFRFYHHFVINGVCCIPPAVGVHPEHKSSDFNHSQVSKALEYAGAHPFFFRKLSK